MSERRISFRVNPPGGRLDQVLASNVEDISRSRLQKLIREGEVRVDKLIVTKPAYQVEGKELIELDIPAPKPSKIIPEKIPLDIIFENQDIIIINKPPGIVVHPSLGHSTGTLVHAVLAHVPDIQGVGGERRPGVVHRLDKDTSGILAMAKNDLAFQVLQKQFSERTVDKTYLALVEGKPPTSTGRIEAAIGRDPNQRQRMAVLPANQGREAITVYKTIETFDQNSCLEVKPITGRTHQIRVHLAFIGSPVVGDRIYGRKKTDIDIKRQFLHAYQINIQIPGEEGQRIFKAPLPQDLEGVLKNLRGDLQVQS